MAKDPAFLFYPGDYLRDTQCLSEACQVAYDRIMCEHMRNICISQEQLNFFTKRLTTEEKNELLFILKKINGGFQIEWVAESIVKRKDYSISRAKNRKSKPNEDVKTYVKHMENEIENKDEFLKGVVGEKFPQNLLIPEMKKTFIKNFPEAFIDENDLPALLEIAKKIFKWLNLQGNFLAHKEQIVENFETIITHCKADSFLQRYSISQINKNFSSVIQSLKSNGINNHQHSPITKLSPSAGRAIANRDY